MEPIKATNKAIQAEAYLDTPEPNQWPRGIFYSDGRVIRSSYVHVRGRSLTSSQDDQGRDLAQRLRAQLQDRLIADGWYQAAKTKAGLPIWRPGEKVNFLSSSSQATIVS